MEAGWLVVSVTGLVPAYIAWRERKKARRLSAAAVSSTSDVTSGPVCARGRIVAAPGEILEAPISKRSCVFYTIDIEVESKERDKDNQRSWSHAKTKTGGGRFAIDDGTGKAKVSASLFEGGLVRTYRGVAPMRGVGEYLDDEAVDLVLSAVGLSGADESGNRRATEHIIPATGNLLVIGTARAGSISDGDGHVFVSRWPRALALAWTNIVWIGYYALAVAFGLTGIALAPDFSRAAMHDGLRHLFGFH